jgi:hypothetical protein
MKKKEKKDTKNISQILEEEEKRRYDPLDKFFKKNKKLLNKIF